MAAHPWERRPSSRVAHPTEVALVDRERQLFEVGPAAEMITPERLGHLYGRRVHVADVGGRTAVVVGAANEEAESPAQTGRPA